METSLRRSVSGHAEGYDESSADIKKAKEQLGSLGYFLAVPVTIRYSMRLVVVSVIRNLAFASRDAAAIHRQAWTALAQVSAGLGWSVWRWSRIWSRPPSRLLRWASPFSQQTTTPSSMLPAQRAERTGNKRPRELSAGPERSAERQHDVTSPLSAQASSSPLTATFMPVPTTDKERESESEDESTRSSQSSKRRRESYAEHDNDRLGPCKEVEQVHKPKTTCDLGDWEALKTLFDHAVHAFDNGDAHAAAHLLHAVLQECNRFLTYYRDPSVLFSEYPDSDNNRSRQKKKKHLSAGALSSGLTPPEERLRRDWGYTDYSSGSGSIESDGMDVESDAGYSSRPGTSSSRKKDKRKRPAEHPTAFHTLFGSALLLYGILVARAQSTSARSTSPAETDEARTSSDFTDSNDSTPSTSTQHTAKIGNDVEKSIPQQLERSPELETNDISYPQAYPAPSRPRPFPLPRPSSLSSFTQASAHSPFPRPYSSSATSFASRFRPAVGSPAQGPSSHDARYYWYAALDVFEAGESVPARTSEGSAPTLLGNEPTLRHTHNVFDHPFHDDPHSIHHGRRHRNKHARLSRQVSGDGKDVGSPPLPEGGAEVREPSSVEEQEARREARKQERREKKEREARESADSLASSPSYIPAESEKEDWRMAVAWGRTLVCLAQTQTSSRPEMASDRKTDNAEDSPSSPDFDILFPSVFSSPLSTRSSSSGSSRPPSSQDYFPTFKPTSPAHVMAPAPTPISITMPTTAAAHSTLSVASHSLIENEDPHQLLVRAMDQFARALLYVPRPTSTDPLPSSTSMVGTGARSEVGTGARPSSFLFEAHHALVAPFAYSSPTTPSPLAAAYAIPLSASAPLASRAYLLLSLASSVLVVATTLPEPEQRAYWARWADGIISVVGITALTGLGGLLGGEGKAQDRQRTPEEEAELKVRVDLTRARCWMMVGDAKSEILKDLTEAGKQMESADAAGVDTDKPRENMEMVDECREAFRKAIEFLEAVRSRAHSLPQEIYSHIMPEEKLREGITFLISQASKMLDIYGHPVLPRPPTPKEGFETTLDSVLLSASSSGQSMASVRVTEAQDRSPSEEPMEEDS